MTGTNNPEKTNQRGMPGIVRVARPVRPLARENVLFLIGVAHGPYLDGFTDIPVALLELAKQIGASLGDRAMVHRCSEMADQMTRARRPNFR